MTMSTQYHDDEGNPVALRFWGGEARGVLIEVSIPAPAWEALETVVSEAGHRIPRTELETQGTLIPWSRLRARALACSLERLARHHSTHPSIAYTLLADAQRVRRENRV